MKILGINSGHNSAACLLADGKLVAAVAEERFTRVKGCAGFPVNAINYCLESQRVDPSDLDSIAVAGSYMPAIPLPTYKKLMDGSGKIMKFAPRLGNVYRIASLPLASLLISDMKNRRRKNLSEYFKVRPDHVYGVDHHTCHAYSALFSSRFVVEGKDVLILTVDGSGDNRSSTVSTFMNGKFETKAFTDASASVGVLYSEMTRHLGMRVDEDEYKVMGLAPYGANNKGEEAHTKLSQMVRFDKDNLRFLSDVHSTKYSDYLRKEFSRIRFDFLAYAVQKMTEELLLSLVKTSVERFKISRLACGGGVFMNVKANMRIAQLPEVSDIFVMPSAGDETNAIGAAYYVHSKLLPDVPISPLENLCLGPEYSAEEIRKELEKHQVNYEKPTDINRAVTQLLLEHRIVARVSGRMEFGARALGNRSILASPNDTSVVQEINRQIKGRDFWMPFAPVIMERTSSSYLRSPETSKVNSDTMVFAFETFPRAQKELAAALHPYDKTARPQVLREGVNEGYYRILSEFEQESNIGALLNTSFNLHGEPIACSPADALHTFESSGLRYLAIGQYLVSKVNRSRVNG